MAARTDTRNEVRAKQRQWLAEVLRISGKTATALADDCGIAGNLLTRFQKEGYEGLLSSLTIKLITDRTGLPGPDDPGGDLPGLGFEEGRQADLRLLERSAPRLAALVKTATKDRPGAAAWILGTPALESSGYLRGDVVIVDVNETPRAGDPVCAQVFDMRRNTAETVFRYFEPPYLVAISADPDLRKPLLIDDKAVIVKGVITESFRYRERG